MPIPNPITLSIDQSIDYGDKLVVHRVRQTLACLVQLVSSIILQTAVVLIGCCRVRLKARTACATDTQSDPRNAACKAENCPTNAKQSTNQSMSSVKLRADFK